MYAIRSYYVSLAVTQNQLWFSLILFFLVYALLFVLFIYLLDRKIKAGPYDESEQEDRPNTKSMMETMINK